MARICSSIFLGIVLLSMSSLRMVRTQGPFGVIKELLQNNVAGEPILHKSIAFDFDPEISKKRRELFYETHGFRADKFIEKLGIGIDGKEEIRRINQVARDQGRLNGEHYINFP